MKKIPIIPRLIRIVIRIIYSCDLPFTANIDKTVDFMHNGLGVVIHARTEIGANSKIYQNVTIGGNGKKNIKNGVPRIGKNVTIYAGAVVIGPIVIGDNSIIGANSVVVSDVPVNSVVVGIPARIIKKGD